MTAYRVGYVLGDGAVTAVFLDSAQNCAPGSLLVWDSQRGEHPLPIETIRAAVPASEEQFREAHGMLVAQRYAALPGYDTLNLVIDQAGLPS